MAQLNPSIILAGQQPNVMNALASGAQAANAVNTVRRQNALADLFQQQGQGIMAGDQGALNALAAQDPRLALDIQNRRQVMDVRGQENARADERLQMAREQARRQAEAQAAQLSAAERAQELAAIDQALAGATAINDPQQWDAYMTSLGMKDLVGQFENREVAFASALGLKDALERADGGGEPASIEALRIRAREAGLEPGTQAYQQFMQSGGKPENGMAIRATPDGGIEFVQGAAAGSDFKFTEGQSKDNVYATKARGALEAFEPVADTLTSRMDRAADIVPFGLARGAQSEDFQVAQQTGTEFLQAILRKDTGAAITQDETDSYGRVYLPQPGDGPAVLEAKREARIRAINAIEAGMTPAQMLARDRALISSAQESIEAGNPAPASSDNPFIGITDEQFRDIDIQSLSPEQLDQLFEARRK